MFGGIAFNKKNELRYSRKITEIEQPDVVTVPLIYFKEQKNSIHVKEKDDVKIGTLLSKAESVNAVNIFSPVSGKVAGIIEKYNEAGDLLPFVVIVNDKKEEIKHLEPINGISQVSIIKRMNDAGLVDEITKKPCHLKYLAQVDRKLNNLIIDCVENEPYVNAKMALFDNRMEEVIRGAGYMAIASGVKNIYFIFSQNDTQFFEKLREKIQILSKLSVNCKICSKKYPSHNHKLLFKEISNIELKDNESTITFGTIIETPSSCLALFEAVEKNIPFYETIVSVYGTNAVFSGNIRVKNGTSVEHICNQLYLDNTPVETIVNSNERTTSNVERPSVVKERVERVVLNSLLSGIAVADWGLSVDICARAVIFQLKNECFIGEEMPCIYCNKCANVCPMKLMPMWIDKALASNNTNTAVEMGAKTCINCGCCAYVCPSRRQIPQRIRIMKNELKGTKNE